MSNNDVSSKKADLTGRIVVGTDLSLRAGHAVDWAAARAAEQGLPLTILLSVPLVPIPARSSLYDAMVLGDFPDRLHDRAEKKSAVERARVRQAYPELDVQSIVETGVPSELLIEASRSAALVVVGARGKSAPFTIPALGGTSDALVTHAHGPVAVITDRSHPKADGPVVVGVDDAPESLAAIRFAVDEAVRHNVKLLAVHSWDSAFWLADVAGSWSVDAATVGTSLETMVKDLVAPYTAGHPNLEVGRAVLPGRASEVLGDATKDASLLVVGSRGRGGFTGLLLGSTSREVLRAAECPVIVVRASRARAHAR